jgi:hypothetical protein
VGSQSWLQAALDIDRKFEVLCYWSGLPQLDSALPAGQSCSGAAPSDTMLESAAASILDICGKPTFIAANVEHLELTYGVCVRVCLPDIDDAIPNSHASPSDTNHPAVSRRLCAHW